jgi:outer membrane lipoprotein SlyB
MSASVCMTIGSRPTADSVALTVDVAREGAQWAARALDGTLRLRVDERAGSLVGTLEGQATAGGITVTIGDGSGAPATAAVTATAGPEAFTGRIEGAVLFAGPGGSQSCSDNGWSLTPQ